jgi:hypothetical protein
MKKLFVSTFSFIMAASLILSTWSLRAFASDEKRINVEGGKDCYITISNVVEEKTLESYPLLIANAPVTVKFVGTNLSRESIEFSTDEKLKDGKLDGNFEQVKFTVKKYTPYGSNQVYDELTQSPEDMVCYITDNYAVLTKPGYYFVNAAPEAFIGSSVIIQVTEGKAAPKVPVTSITKLDLASEIVKISGVEKEVIKNQAKYAKYCVFKDVQTNLKNYVGYVYNKGWITSKSKTEFGVKDQATVDMAARAILKATGKTINTANIKAVTGKTTGTVVTKERLKEMFNNAKAIKK